MKCCGSHFWLSQFKYLPMEIQRKNIELMRTSNPKTKTKTLFTPHMFIYVSNRSNEFPTIFMIFAMPILSIGKIESHIPINHRDHSMHLFVIFVEARILTFYLFCFRIEIHKWTKCQCLSMFLFSVRNFCSALKTKL